MTDDVLTVRSADQADSGFLVLADISGFTAFVTATELEHGAEVTATLLAHVMEALAPPLEIQELEGDAVFALGADREGRPAVLVLEAFDRAFTAFGRRQRELSLDTSCACRACSGVLALRLKLIVHHGSFLRQTVGGRARVAGPDVILAHRFLKNDVASATYALFTSAAVERIGIDPSATAMRPYTGSYAHFGEVEGFVVTLGRGNDGAPLLRLRALLGDLALDAHPGPEDALRPIVAA